MELATRTGIAIRTMALDDLPAVLEIQSACYTAIQPESRQSLQAKIVASASTCLVASLEGDTVGYFIALPWMAASPPRLDAQTCELPASPDCLYLHDLAVAPAARSSGAGRLLVETMLGRLRALHLGRACLIAIQDSGPYWARYGFRAVPPSAGLAARLSTYGEGVQYMELEDAARQPVHPRGVHPSMLSVTVAALEAFPQQLEAHYAAIPAGFAHWAPPSWEGIPSEPLTALEQVCHVRDIEVDGYHVRFERTLNEHHPTLASLDTEALAQERDYANADAAAVLASFRLARARTVALIQGLSPAQLERTAVFTGYGPLTVRSLVHYLCSHDQQHLAGLQWLLGKIEGTGHAPRD